MSCMLITHTHGFLVTATKDAHMIIAMLIALALHPCVAGETNQKSQDHIYTSTHALTMDQAYRNTNHLSPSTIYEVTFTVALLCFAMYIALNAVQRHNSAQLAKKHRVLSIVADAKHLATLIESVVRYQKAIIQIVCDVSWNEDNADALCQNLSEMLENVQVEQFRSWSESFRVQRSNSVAVCANPSITVGAIRLIAQNRHSVIAVRNACDLQGVANATMCTVKYLRQGPREDIHRTLQTMRPEMSKSQRERVIDQSKCIPADRQQIIYVRTQFKDS